MIRIASLAELSLLCFVSVSVIAGCQSRTEAPVRPTAPKPESGATTGTTPTEPKAQRESETPFELEADFALLTFPQFESFAAEPETWKETTEGIACTGKPRGYLYSQQSYKNFTLRLDYRFERPANLKDDAKFKGNTGFLVYVSGEHKLWPVCLEVQGKHIQMAAIKENGGADAVTVEDDDAARQQARKSVGSWNSLEIVSKEGAINVTLNGTPISHSQPGGLVEGKLGIQSEDFPFEVRRMRIRAE